MKTHDYSTHYFQSLFNHQGGGVGVLLFLLILFGSVHFLAGHHVVLTDGGLKIYPKLHFSLKETFLDIRELSAEELNSYRDVMFVMFQHGDLYYIKNGQNVKSGIYKGESIYQIMERLDDQFVF